MAAVIDGARVPQAGPAALHGLEQCFLALHVEIRVLLPGETGFGQVFGGGGGTHRHGMIIQLLVSRANLGFKRFRQIGLGEQALDSRRAVFQLTRTGGFQLSKLGLDGLGQVVLLEIIPVGLGKDRKPAGDVKTRLNQAGQIGSLTAGVLQIEGLRTQRLDERMKI